MKNSRLFTSFSFYRFVLAHFIAMLINFYYYWRIFIKYQRYEKINVKYIGDIYVAILFKLY